MFVGIGLFSSDRHRASGLGLVALAVTLVFAATTLIPDDAHAQRVRTSFKDTVHVVQPKPVLQKKRFEIAPRLGASINDDIFQSFRVGATATYHITESIHVGALFDWYDFGETLGGPTGSFEQLRNQTGASTDTAKINFTGGLEVGFVPIHGKFSLFDSALVFYDFSVSAGGLWIDAESVAVGVAEGKPGGTIALTGRFFLNKWIALNAELRDVIFMQQLQDGGDAFTNVVTTGFGFSFYFPTTFEYSDSVETPEL